MKRRRLFGLLGAAAVAAPALVFTAKGAEAAPVENKPAGYAPPGCLVLGSRVSILGGSIHLPGGRLMASPGATDIVIMNNVISSLSDDGISITGTRIFDKYGRP